MTTNPTDTAAAVAEARHQFWHIIHGGVLGTFVENDKAKARWAAEHVVEYARTVEEWLDDASTFPREWVERHAMRDDLRAALAAYDALKEQQP